MWIACTGSLNESSIVYVSLRCYTVEIITLAARTGA